MIVKPEYFEPIRREAARRWDQLERDPDLAAPWHQLFRQVQSPRHVLSELLQNADDAGATEAAIHIEGRTFIFSHNGHDFDREEFASLCRFGYSNKRVLHTIGFRGIGFKSTFSLGNPVSLNTPTLSIAFDQGRFTEPKWVERVSRSFPKVTEVRVPIADAARERQLERNLDEWLKSPVSLLFFKQLRKLKIAGQEIHWCRLGNGPVENTFWMEMQGRASDKLLLARSVEEKFPKDALEEIRQERMIEDRAGAAFPPCRVEIVLGAPGQLYVVLPTRVATTLPFACNAPFIQDPGRLKVKDPETSPTNRWLLARTGRLAASVMLGWLRNETLEIGERAGAYSLLPNVNRGDESLEGACATLVEEAFEQALGSQPILLTSEGELRSWGSVASYPLELYEVWDSEQIGGLFDESERPGLSQVVRSENREKLIAWGAVEEIGTAEILGILAKNSLPRPTSWARLLRLWSYLAPELARWQNYPLHNKIKIAPVQGKEALYARSELVRLGEGRLLQSEDDWKFLSDYLLVLNPNWPRFLAEQRRKANQCSDEELGERVHSAEGVLRLLNLDGASNADDIIDRVARPFFARQEIESSDCVRLAQIAAKLAVTVGESFYFETRDSYLRGRSGGIIYDEDGSVEQLLPASWIEAHLLTSEYSEDFRSCTRDEWRRWAFSSQSGILTFAPLTEKQQSIYGKRKFEGELSRRESQPPTSYHYRNEWFQIADWDFEQELWEFWEDTANDDPAVWCRVIDKLLANSALFSNSSAARAIQISTNRTARLFSDLKLLPDWVLRFRSLPCLRDTRGIPRKPSELLRRTPETEALLDVEPFVDAHIDRESTRPLLQLLGVRDVPTGPRRILECLSSLASSSSPPIAEVMKWYNRLDHLVDALSTDDAASLRQAFREQKLILAEDGTWCSSGAVYLQADEDDVPGAPIVRPAVRDLSLWRKIGVAERPTADLAISWLRTISENETLSPEDVRRIRALLGRHARRIWHECGHWLNLAGEWVETGTLKYSLTMQSLTIYSHLHEWVKKATADFQRLSVEITETQPFSELPRLATQLEERLANELRKRGVAERQPWLVQCGKELSRMALADAVQQQRIRKLGESLAQTTWRRVSGLEVTSYLDGTPAGVPVAVPVVWSDRILFVNDLPAAKLARLVPERLGRAFADHDITLALNYCFGRTAEDVTEYFATNFELDSEHTASPAAAKTETRDVAGTEAPTPESTTGGSPEVTDSDFDDFAIELNTAEAASVPHDSIDTQHDPVETPPARPKRQAGSLMEKFALAQGFRQAGEDRFLHPDGGRIEKIRGESFPWVRRDSSGEPEKYYLPEEHCLDSSPLSIRHEQFVMLRDLPDVYSLVLFDLSDTPIEVTGAELSAMIGRHEITLYPASYRLKKEERVERPAA